MSEPLRRQQSRFRQPDPLPALRYVGSPRNHRTMSRILGALLVVIPVALVFTPWQQNVSGSGQVVAFSPEERIQEIDAPIDGRIARWHVVEGSHVEAGDLLVELADNDPSLIDRLAQERQAMADTLQAAEAKVLSYEAKIAGVEATRLSAVEAARTRLDVATDKIRAAEQARDGALAARETAELNYARRQQLNQRGLASNRDLELAELTLAKTRADADKAIASLNAERNTRLALEADLRKIEADMTAKIQEARAQADEARSSVAKARAGLAKADVQLSRQSRQVVTAPVTGTVFSILARQSGDLLKAGEPLAVLVPDSTKDVVELWMDGRDIPLISPGRTVRLQFEGWPALQFSGWPSVAVGTFGGRVMLVDATDDGKGRFRILVEADPDDEPWPDPVYLRQGARANGWVLLDRVSLGFELWRQFNGFPPVLTGSKPLVKVKTKVGQ